MREPPSAAGAANTLGVLMLETRFPRIRGDIGHAATFLHPVRYTVVRGASAQRVVREQDPALLVPFIEAARRLVADGVAAITTSCGFLVLFQQELQQAVSVPVWTSSLLLLPELPTAGVVTVDATSLSARHLAAANADPATPIEGLEAGCAFQRTLLEDLPQLDVADAQGQVVAAAQRLVRRHPAITDIVLECTNMPPYADAVRRATGRAVHDITTLVSQRFNALQP